MVGKKLKENQGNVRQGYNQTLRTSSLSPFQHVTLFFCRPELTRAGDTSTGMTAAESYFILEL
jgi:hypothetical protein